MKHKESFKALEISIAALNDIDFPNFMRQGKAEKPAPVRKQGGSNQKQLIVIHEKFFKKLESLVSTEEGIALSRNKATPGSLQRIESLINEASELVLQDEQAALQRMSDLFEEMLPLFGRGDPDMRALNKQLRGLITI